MLLQTVQVFITRYCVYNNCVDNFQKNDNYNECIHVVVYKHVIFHVRGCASRAKLVIKLSCMQFEIQ